jgi:hypothetical protein
VELIDPLIVFYSYFGLTMRLPLMTPELLNATFVKYPGADHGYGNVDAKGNAGLFANGDANNDPAVYNDGDADTNPIPGVSKKSAGNGRLDQRSSAASAELRVGLHDGVEIGDDLFGVRTDTWSSIHSISVFMSHSEVSHASSNAVVSTGPSQSSAKSPVAQSAS